MNVCRLFTMISIALFAYSLTQECYTVEGDVPGGGAVGFMLLLVGWLGPLSGVFAWFANPTLLLAWVLMVVKSKKRGAIVCSLAALALALSFLLHGEIMTNEGGTMSKITGYAAGYRWWIASIVVAVIGSALGYMDERMTPQATDTRRTKNHD